MPFSLVGYREIKLGSFVIFAIVLAFGRLLENIRFSYNSCNPLIDFFPLIQFGSVDDFW